MNEITQSHVVSNSDDPQWWPVVVANTSDLFGYRLVTRDALRTPTPPHPPDVSGSPT